MELVPNLSADWLTYDHWWTTISIDSDSLIWAYLDHNDGGCMESKVGGEFTMDGQSKIWIYYTGKGVGIAQLGWVCISLYTHGLVITLGLYGRPINVALL